MANTTTRRFYANSAPQLTISGSITAGATSLTIAGTFAGWPVTFPYQALLDGGTLSAEVVLVTNVVGTTATITRAQDGTSAVSHLAGATIDQVVSRRDFDEANLHSSSTSNVHGVASAVVGVTDTQTLTNKTLSAPNLTSPVFTNAVPGNLTVNGNLTVGGTFTPTNFPADTGWVTSTAGFVDGALAGGGTATVNSCALRKVGNVISINVTLTLSGGVWSVPSDGNIVNLVLCTIPTAFWPSRVVSVAGTLNGPVMAGEVSATGQLILTATTPNVTLGSGNASVLTFAGTYLD